ncbi:hypothetical protein J41TS2_38910 [Bacillus sonorensis]|nr:hypothetical protein J41TS2_38910 [Bacillus sonorensis]
MYFIEKQEELIGKEIAYVWANQFCSKQLSLQKIKVYLWFAKKLAGRMEI